MKSKAKDEKYSTTRACYKKVKKFDHAQFDEFCTRIYIEGVEEGRNSVSVVVLEQVMEQIKTIKGIGGKRLDQIEAVVETTFRERNGTPK